MWLINIKKLTLIKCVHSAQWVACWPQNDKVGTILVGSKSDIGVKIIDTKRIGFSHLITQKN